MRSTMKKALSIVIALALLLVPMTAFAATGEMEDPHIVEAGAAATTVEIAAEGYAWFQATGSYANGAVTVTTDATNYTIFYRNISQSNGFTLYDSADMFYIRNDSTEAINVEVSIAEGSGVATGTWDNPAILTLDEWGGAYDYVSLEDDNMGYYWKVTATDDGVMGFRASANDENWAEIGWEMRVNNETTGVYGDFCDYSYNGQYYEERVSVSAGDVISIYAATLEIDGWDYTYIAGNLSISVSTYTFGSYDLPDTPNMGMNVISGNDGTTYWYQYDVTEAGILTFTMNTETNWAYSVEVTSDNDWEGDYRWSDDNPVVPSSSYYVLPGDKVMISVNAYDPDDWFYVGDVEWTLSFIPGEYNITTSHAKDQIRFDKNEDESYAGTFDYRTLATISNANIIFGNADKIASDWDGNYIAEAGFIFNRGSEIDLEVALEQIKGGEAVYAQVNNAYITTTSSLGEYVMACQVRDVADADVNETLSSVAYIIYVVNGETYYALYDAAYTTTFAGLYNEYYNSAFPS